MLDKVCKQNPCLRFLLDDLTLEEMDSKRVRTSKPKAETRKEEPVAKNSISNFFRKAK